MTEFTHIHVQAQQSRLLRFKSKGACPELNRDPSTSVVTLDVA